MLLDLPDGLHNLSIIHQIPGLIFCPDSSLFQALCNLGRLVQGSKVRLAELFIVADVSLLLQMCEPFNRQLYVIRDRYTQER